MVYGGTGYPAEYLQEANRKVTDANLQMASGNVQLSDLQDQMDNYKSQVEDANSDRDDALAKVKSYEDLLSAANTYISGDTSAAANAVTAIDGEAGRKRENAVRHHEKRRIGNLIQYVLSGRNDGLHERRLSDGG